MNTDPSSVPIITLAGISSLTNLLSELPFPNPLPQTRKNSLLHSSWLTSEAQKALDAPQNSANPALTQELLQVLRNTSSDHVEAGEGANADPVVGPGAPELLKTIVLNDGTIFKPGPAFNSSNNPGYALVGHNELYPSNQRMLEEGAYNNMQSPVNVPCLPYEHQPLPMQGHPYQNQDFEYLMNGINPALMQQMAANQGAGALLRGGAMLQASNQFRTGELNHFPGGLISAQYPNQNASHPLMANFMGSMQSVAADGNFKIAGTPPSGMMGIVQNSNKSFVESSPAQASSAPPAGAEPVIRMGNTGSSAFDQAVGSTPLPNSPYGTAGYVTFQTLAQPQSLPFSASPMATQNQHRPMQTQKQQQQQQQHQQQMARQMHQQQQQQQHHHHQQQHNFQQHLYQQQDLLTRDLSNVKVVLEPLDMEAHKTQLKKPPSDSGIAQKVSGDMSPRVSLTRLDDKKDKSMGNTNNNVMQYNVVQDSTQNLKIKLSKKGVKRRHSDDDEDDDDSRESCDFSSSLTERVKRRRRSNSAYVDSKQVEEDDNEEETQRRGFLYDNSDLSSGPSSVSEVSRRKEEKKKKRHHHHHHHHHRHSSSLPNDGLDDDHPEGATVRKFHALIDQVVEAAEEIDLSTFKDDDDETSCLTETIISKQLLLEVVSEAAKLKTVTNMNQVPYEKLIKLLTLLQFSIKQGLRNVPLNEVDDEVGDDLFRELTLEHVTCGLDACLAAMLVMTSKDMPKQVFIEDVIDKVVRFTRNHLRNFIYPVFDPVYRVDPSGKGGQSGMKMKRSKASMMSMKDRTILSIYNKLTDVTSLLAELVDIQDLTDTIVLQMSSLSVSPFFVENIPELQLNALKLVTNIFSKYEKHRQLILEDILSSLARLPSSKKNLRSYRLNINENIQMVTALALQLIQCVVELPFGREERIEEEDDDEEADDCATGDDVERGRREKKKRKKSAAVADAEVVAMSSYETARSTAHNFLHVFLGKCSAKEEDDYRSLFGNFVNDLLSTVNKPEWPAAELLLSLLGHLLVRQFSSKSVEMSLRVASLDYLGIVAARLRKDAVSSRLDEGTLDDIASRVAEREEEAKRPSRAKVLDSDEDDDAAIVKDAGGENEGTNEQKTSEINRTQSLQKALLEYLASNTEADPALTFARRFYIAQWLRDCGKEIEMKTKRMEEQERRESGSRTSTPRKQRQRQKSRPKKPKKRKPRNSRRQDDDGDESEEDEEGTDSEETEEEDYDEESGIARKTSQEMEWLKVTQMEVEKRKQFLFKEAAKFKKFTSSIRQSKTKLDYDSALLVARYLASDRPFSQSFDIYLTQILKVLNDTAVAVRSRALKCLAAVVEADPGVLAKKDMQLAVHTRFIDSSTSVREAAIELVGKFVLIRPELTAQYYDMLSERILDTGISVRKRVIKIFRDVCLEQPNFPKVPEMCVKMVRRVNDEEGIRKLVNETFQSMWFSPCRDKDASSLLQKVLNITEVASIASTSIGFEWLERLMENLLKAEEGSKEKPVLKSCRQIVDCLVDNVLQLETNADATNSRLAACFSTLYLFCKVKPILLVKHCTLIHPYLNIKFMTKSDILIASNVVKMLELAVPLMEHPGESFLAQLEEDISKLVLRQGAVVIQSGISCLGAIVRDITHNYKLILDCFNKFYGISTRIREGHFGFMGDNVKSCLRRSLFVVGQLCKQFDFDAPEFEEFREMSCIKEKVFELLLHFIDFPDIKVQALAALGCLTTRYYELMLGKELRDIYQKMLTDPGVESNMCCQVLNNIKEYLVEEEVKMAKADAEWRKLHDKENLKEMGDVQSGMASTIIQIYLKQILESFFHMDPQVRMAALEVVTLILNQGLVHPQQCMAQLICMGSDPNINIRLKADKQIMEIDKKYPGFVQARAMQGIKMSCRLQKLLHQHVDRQQPGGQQLRGVRVEENGTLTSLNSYIYSLVRTNRSNRRVVVMNALRMFEDKTPLEELLYMADNLAYFSYQLQDEPLFVIHQIDIILSVSGFNLLQSFKEGFYPPPVHPCPLENGTSSVKREEDDNSGEGETKPEPPSLEDGVTVKAEPKEEMKCESSSTPQTQLHDQQTKEQQRPLVQRYDEDDDEEDDPETLLALIPVEGDSMVELYTSLQGYLLLLVLKQHLKEMYGFTDNKIQQYSPMDFKVYEKSVNRKHGVKFQPNQVLELLARAEPLCQRNAEHRREIVNAYLNFKELMASIDKEDMDDDASPTTAANNLQDGNSIVNNSSTFPNGPQHQAIAKRSSAPSSGKSRKTNNRQGTSVRASHGQQSSSKKVKKKPKRRKNVCSDSDEDDDDDCDDDDDADWQ